MVALKQQSVQVQSSDQRLPDRGRRFGKQPSDVLMTVLPAR